MLSVQQIAFVTRRFEELEGLRTAALGAAVLGSALATVYLSASSGYLPDPFQCVMLGIAGTGLGHHYFHRRYSDTFGRLRPDRFDLTAFVTMPQFLFAIGGIVDLTGRAHTQAPSYAAVGVAVSSAAVLLRDGRWRPHYLIPLASALIAAAATASVPPLAYIASYQQDPRRVPLYLFAYALVGAGLIAAGLLDHLLLGHTLAPAANRSRVHAVTARMRASAAQAPFAALCASLALVTLCFPARYMSPVLPLLLAFTFMGMTIVRAFGQTWRLARSFPTGVLPHQPFSVDAALAAWLCALALAALVDTARVGSGPVLTAVTFAVASADIARREWPLRRHYLLGATAAILVAVAMPYLSHAVSFTLLLFVASAALAIETTIDGRLARDRAAGDPESTHADTI